MKINLTPNCISKKINNRSIFTNNASSSQFRNKISFKNLEEFENDKWEDRDTNNDYSVVYKSAEETKKYIEIKKNKYGYIDILLTLLNQNDQGENVLHQTSKWSADNNKINDNVKKTSIILNALKPADKIKILASKNYMGETPIDVAIESFGYPSDILEMFIEEIANALEKDSWPDINSKTDFRAIGKKIIEDFPDETNFEQCKKLESQLKK